MDAAEQGTRTGLEFASGRIRAAVCGGVKVNEFIETFFKEKKDGINEDMLYVRDMILYSMYKYDAPE